MLGKNQQHNDELDRIGRVVLRAAAASEGESEAAANSPFLFTRVRVRIAEEQRRRDEAGNWFSLISIARRAIPAMALIALLAATVMFWMSRPAATPAWYRLDEEALSDTRNPGVEQTVLSRNSLSPDDVVNIVIEHGEREKR